MNRMMKKVSIITVIAVILQLFLPVLSISYAFGTEEVLQIEAESIDATSEFKKVSDTSAQVSGDSYLQSTVSNIPDYGAPTEDTDGVLKYTFDTKQAGYYNIWIRSRSTTTSNDSVWYAAVNTSDYVYKEFSINESFLWTKMERVYLTPGTHFVKFLSREAYGFCLDKILITNVSYYIPSGASGENNFNDENLPDTYGSPKIYPPANEHPRVLVREGEQLEKIKADLTHPQNINMYNRVLYYAAPERNIDGNLPANNNNYSETALAVAESCAFMYLIDTENNISYGERAIDIIKNICNTVVLTGNRFPTRTAGHVIYITSLVYDWCYDLLSDDDKKELIGHIINLATTMEIGWPATKQGNFVGHAGEEQLLKDLFAAAVAIYDEYPGFYELVGGRLYNEMIPARNYLYQGHYFQIGSGYGPVRYSCDLRNAFMLKALGDTTSYSEDQKYMMYEMIYNRRPDGVKSVYGDCYDIFDGYNTTDLAAFFLAANYYKDEYLKKEYYRINPAGNNYYSSNSSISAVLHLIVNDVSVGAKSFQNLPLTALYEGSNGTMIARSSWDEGNDSDTVLVRMNFQNKLIGSHQHLDSGSFDIYYKGSLALDSGVYESLPWTHEDGTEETNLSYGSVHDMNYHKLSVAHNVMLVKMPGEKLGYVSTEVNDGGQRGPVGVGASGNTTLNNIADLENNNYNIGTVLSRDIGDDLNKPDYSYIKGDITKAYSDAKMEKYIRTFMYLNFFDEDYPAALIVFDDIKSTNAEYEKTWLLHTEEEPVVNTALNEVTIQRTENGYTGGMVNKTLLPQTADTKYTVIGGEGNKFYVDGKNFPAVPEQGVEVGKYRVEITTNSKNQQDYYLNVMEIGKNGEKYPSSAQLVLNSDSYVGVKVKDRAVFLRKGSDKQSDDFEITLAEADEDLKYIVTGLKEGTWTVTKDNITVYTAEVSEKSDVLTFTAGAGTYKLTYSEKEVNDKNLFFINNMSESIGNKTDIKINKEMITFENEPVITENGNLLVCGEEYLEHLGITPDVSTEHKLSYKTAYREVVFENGKSTVSVNGVELTLNEASAVYNGKLYISPIDAQAPLGTTVIYNDIGGILATTVQSDTITETNKITVTANEGGTVSPGGIILAADNSSVSVEITPDTDYYIKEVTYNGVPLGAYDSTGKVKLRTPAVTEDSSLKVVFEKISEVEEPVIQTVPYTVKNGKETYVFGRINNTGFDLNEYGVLYSALNAKPEYSGENVTAIKSLYDYNNSGYYGFRIVQPVEDMQYYIRAYAVYNNGTTVHAKDVLNISSGQLEDISTVYNNGEIILTDDTYVDKASASAGNNYNFSSSQSTTERTQFNLMHPGGYTSLHGRRAYLMFDISNVEGVSGGAVLKLYAKGVNGTGENDPSTVKYLSIYALDNEFDETTLTHNNSEAFGKCLGTLKVDDSSEWIELEYDITDYLKEKLEKGYKYISIGVGINEDWQKQIYPNGSPGTNFYLYMMGKPNSLKPEIILH